jgi:hypothetical protein
VLGISVAQRVISGAMACRHRSGGMLPASISYRCIRLNENISDCPRLGENVKKQWK